MESDLEPIELAVEMFEKKRNIQTSVSFFYVNALEDLVKSLILERVLDVPLATADKRLGLSSRLSKFSRAVGSLRGVAMRFTPVPVIPLALEKMFVMP